ncbi:Uncharacterized protein Fot_05580 [Forsythia ovata]|uniref:Uncharacterized protein n=1 Tax=Forsythia ovata TaxID=205694 RepID=A0ABD1WQU4_9LAMI
MPLESESLNKRYILMGDVYIVMIVPKEELELQSHSHALSLSHINKEFHLELLFRAPNIGEAFHPEFAQFDNCDINPDRRYEAQRALVNQVGAVAAAVIYCLYEQSLTIEALKSGATWDPKNGTLLQSLALATAALKALRQHPSGAERPSF